MKVLFLKTIQNVARKGDVREVADGYAINFLLPKGLAIQTTNKLFVQTNEEFKKQVVKAEKNKFDPVKLAQRLRSVSISCSEKADEAGTFFAGVTKEKLSKLLEQNGCDIRAKQIILNSPIKKAGIYRIEVNVASGVKSEFKVTAKAL